jgi:putative hydrolase of the HAD superfamily
MYDHGTSHPDLSPGSIDTLLFDIGRVVIDFDLQRAFVRWAAHAGCSVDDLANCFKVDDVYRQHERGECFRCGIFCRTPSITGY